MANEQWRVGILEREGVLSKLDISAPDADIACRDYLVARLNIKKDLELTDLPKEFTLVADRRVPLSSKEGAPVFWMRRQIRVSRG